MIDIVFVGNIATCGMATFSRELITPHRLRTYPCDLAEAEVLVGSPISRRMLEQAPKLRLVHASGAGCDAIAVDALRGGIPLCNVFHHERAMAEYAIMTMLALDRDLFRQDRNLRQGIWDGSCTVGPPQISELNGKIRSGHTRQELEALLGGSDFLLLACPLTDETRGLMGAAEFARMRPTASLINVARADVVDESALYEALRDRRIRSAAIDVWYQYPRDGE